MGRAGVLLWTLNSATGTCDAEEAGRTSLSQASQEAICPFDSGSEMAPFGRGQQQQRSSRPAWARQDCLRTQNKTRQKLRARQWWCTPATPALRRQPQKDLWRLGPAWATQGASVRPVGEGCIVRPYLRKSNKKPNFPKVT